MFGANSITNISLDDFFNIITNNSPWIPVNPCIAARRVCSDLLCRMHQERLWCHYNWRNPLVNPQVHCQDNNMEGPVTQ